MKRTIGSLFLSFGMILFLFSQAAVADTLKIGIMQDKRGVSKTYEPLIKYCESKGIKIKLKVFRSYSFAAEKFARGYADVMFTGSGVAGAMIIKDIAYPVLRPVNKSGWSTYWAVILAPKGSAKYMGDTAYFDGKKIVCNSLASSGEFFVRSILGPEREIIKAKSHGEAIKILSRGKADIAIVKNRVWDSVKDKFPNLEQVGQDHGENPYHTLIASHKADKALVAKFKALLVELEQDNSDEAIAVKTSLNVSKFIPTDKDDFSHTLMLLEKAGVTKEFSFIY